MRRKWQERTTAKPRRVTTFPTRALPPNTPQLLPGLGRPTCLSGREAAGLCRQPRPASPGRPNLGRGAFWRDGQLARAVYLGLGP